MTVTMGRGPLVTDEQSCPAGLMSNLLKFRQAIEAGDGEKVRAMLASDPELVDNRVHRNLKPVLLAAYCGQLRVVDVLLACGATLDVCTCAVLGKTDRLGDLLSADPALVGTHSPDGWTPLHLAARFDQKKAAEILLAYGADVRDASNDWGLTPLHSANSTEMVETLLRHGADLNVKARKGWTLLHGQAVQSDAAFIRFLLEQGADPGARTKANQTPWSLAVQQGNRAAADALFRWRKRETRRC